MLTVLQGGSLGYARDDNGTKRYQNSAALPYFYAPHHHSSLLTPNSSLESAKLSYAIMGRHAPRLTLIKLHFIEIGDFVENRAF